jgi:RNA polymerase sigma factor (sigma-70 family)
VVTYILHPARLVAAECSSACVSPALLALRCLLSTEPEPEFDTIRLHACIDQMRSGDSRGADRLLRQVGDRLERLARRMIKSFPNVSRWTDTEDVLQSALVRLLHSLRALSPAHTRDFFNLAAVHIRRELLDLARQYRHHLDPAHGEAQDHSDALAAIPDHGNSAQDLDLWTAFHEEVERLPAEEREVIGLTFYHGWTQAQIAELFGVDERTIRRRTKVARTKLTCILGQLPEE